MLSNRVAVNEFICVADKIYPLSSYSRHLLRLWLRDPENAWPTPEAWRYRWAQLYEGVTPEGQVFPLEPFIRSAGNKGR